MKRLIVVFAMAPNRWMMIIHIYSDFQVLTNSNMNYEAEDNFSQKIFSQTKWLKNDEKVENSWKYILKTVTNSNFSISFFSIIIRSEIQVTYTTWFLIFVPYLRYSRSEIYSSFLFWWIKLIVFNIFQFWFWNGSVQHPYWEISLSYLYNEWE